MGSRASSTVTAAAAFAVAATLAAPDPADGARKRAAAEPQQASVELVECSQGRRRHDRWALFRGEMEQVAGGERMRMRFQLTERIARGRWRPVRAPGLGVWQDSHRGAPAFAYGQRVVGLERATAYRVRVAFRWHDARGGVVAAEEHGSRPCRQRGRLANLALRGDVRVRPGPLPDTARYAVRVVNDGRALARRVRLRLSVDGAAVETRTIGPVRAGRSRVARFVGPACAATVAIRADPDDAIRETSEEDNVASAVCPPGE